MKLGTSTEAPPMLKISQTVFFLLRFGAVTSYDFCCAAAVLTAVGRLTSVNVQGMGDQFRASHSLVPDFTPLASRRRGLGGFRDLLSVRPCG
ncbi:hypothetical protein PoB_005461300 [Plakobranchus ocellatus]|uniref:Uncharacterized protein n=1 Tax=Plakobranchus ocellatus TaxID=259542 RepID=A0AAV4CAU2_9GAST|nr:hypothetical protein PoB_005461300 [Plakobranchus ocellatus]